MFSRNHRLGRPSFTGVAIMLIAAGACKSDNNNTAPLVASSISLVAGDGGQTGAAGVALTQPIAILVVDQNGNPLPGVTVTWQVTAGGGSIDTATSVTGSTGNASVVWTLGTTVGVDSLVASIPSGGNVRIGATAVAGPPATIAKVSGDGQTVTSGSTTLPLVVDVTDAFGNPVPSIAVGWSVQGGGSLSSASTNTGANGQTQVTLTTALTPGTYVVTASVANVATVVTFTVNGD